MYVYVCIYVYMYSCMYASVDSTAVNPCGIRTHLAGTLTGRYVHYLEAILYSGVDPYSYRKFVLTSLNLVVGTKQVH